MRKMNTNTISENREPESELKDELKSLFSKYGLIDIIGALKDFEIDIYDYLLSQVSLLKSEGTLEKSQNHFKDDFLQKFVSNQFAKKRQLKSGDKILIDNNHKYWYIDVNKIRLLESEGRYIRVYFDTFSPTILSTLNAIGEILDSQTFFRANRKYIINLNWLSSIEVSDNGGLLVTLQGDEKIEISRRQTVKFKDQMGIR